MNNMKYVFPPTSPYDELIGQMLQPYATLISGKNAIYVSTPMTSGLLYMDSLAKMTPEERNTGLSEQAKQQLFEQNCQHAKTVAAMTKWMYPHAYVIDPTQFSMKGWEQNDYLTFWREVLLGYVNTIRFVNNWYYSNGCAYEFLVGATSNKIMIDEGGKTINVREGRNLIKKAYDEHLTNGYDNTFLLDVVKALDV
jgi:hypothetical protein